jgi:serine/threonine protein kinase
LLVGREKGQFHKTRRARNRLHENVCHPGIISLFDVFEIDDNAIAIILEVCNRVDLDARLKRQCQLSEQDTYIILLHILSGMMYPSHPSEDDSCWGIIHYDFEPANKLLDQDGDGKITGFGLYMIMNLLNTT